MNAIDLPSNRHLYLDIETIPSQSEKLHAQIADGITPPASMSKQETIDAWTRDKKPEAIKTAIAKTALDGASGHICCIGWALDDGEINTTMFKAGDDEGAFLCGFVDALNKSLHQYDQVCIVGHNVASFDIRFIWQRAIVLGVTMPHWLPRDPKPWSESVFDTMAAFVGHREMIGMSRLCEALDIEGKGEIDGSMVGDLWAAGEYDKIAEYCRDDVDRTRQIHRKMMIAFGEAA